MDATSVTAATAAALDGLDGPLVASALRLASLLDDVDTSARDAASLSRELRQVLADVEAQRPAVGDPAVFDLEARRAARERRREA